MIQIRDKEITIFEGADNTAAMIIIIAAVLIFLVLIVLTVRFVCNKIRAEKVKQE